MSSDRNPRIHTAGVPRLHQSLCPVTVDTRLLLSGGSVEVLQQKNPVYEFWQKLRIHTVLLSPTLLFQRLPEKILLFKMTRLLYSRAELVTFYGSFRCSLAQLLRFG